MPRPLKCRNIHFTPDYYRFKPAEVPGRFLKQIILSEDEFEAIRLADYEGLYQESAAEQMNISRQTFGNIIVSARKKVADALINGGMLIIKGENKVMKDSVRHFRCDDCNEEWTEPFGTGRPSECPKCKSENFRRSDNNNGMRHRMRMRRRRGQNHKSDE